MSDGLFDSFISKKEVVSSLWDSKIGFISLLFDAICEPLSIDSEIILIEIF